MQVAQTSSEIRPGHEPHTTYIPNSPEGRERAGITDIDIVEAVKYYRTESQFSE